MNAVLSPLSLAPLLDYNLFLLKEAERMIKRLQKEAKPEFIYGKAIGPHVRHIIEHYSALVTAFRQNANGASPVIAYDKRIRDMAVQSQSDMTIARLQLLSEELQTQIGAGPFTLDTTVQTIFQAGAEGEMEYVSSSTLGRELLFLSSHTVHHFALIAVYCREAGVELGHDFGKAPATLAYEHKH